MERDWRRSGWPVTEREEDQLRRNTWWVLRLQGNPTVSEAEKHLSLAMAIITALCFDGFGETYSGRSRVIITVEAHCEAVLSRVLTPPHAPSQAASLDNPSPSRCISILKAFKGHCSFLDIFYGSYPSAR